MTVEDFTTSGTWTVPAGVTEVVAEVYSDGGGGKSTNPIGVPGFCGGSGAYRRATISVTPGQSISYTVGQGGPGGGAAQNGFDGTGSSFGSYITCTGGQGGQLAAAAGGVASGSATPDESIDGNAGSATVGGTCPGPLGGAGGARANPPVAGSIVGGGGGARLSGANMAGAAGARGLVRLTYTAPTTAEGSASGSHSWTAEASGITDYSGSASGSHIWDGIALSGETPDSITMAQVRAAIADRENGRVNIGLFGASVCEGYPAPIDLWIETQLAEKLRARFPTSDLGSGGGYGYIGIPTFGLENTATTPVGYSGGAFNEALGWGGHHRIWYASALQTSPGLSLTLPADASSVVIETVTGASGSSVGGRYRVNGGSWVVFSTLSGSVGVLDVTVPGPLSAGDVIEIAHNTSGTGNVVVSGFRVYDGDETKGIQVHNHGHYGYRIQDWNAARNVADPANWINTMNDYDLLIFSDWGGNDGSGPGDLSAAQFYTAFSELITWMRTTGGYAGDILIASLYNIEFARTFVDPWSEYVNAQHEIALEQGVAFIQLDEFMPATPNAIYAPDNIHGNADGSAYEIMAELFFSRIAGTGGLAEGYWDVTGSSTGENDPIGEVDASWSITGNAAGETDLQGAASGAHSWAGSTEGERESAGESTAAHQWAGAAEGAVDHRGSAAGASAWTGDADGIVDRSGSAAGAHQWGGATAGEIATEGEASGAHQWTGAALGRSVHAGDADGSHDWATSAEGSMPAGGEAVGSHAWTGSADGAAAYQGAASGSHHWAGVAVGDGADAGLASGSHQWSGSATGRHSAEGSADGAHQWAGGAHGSLINNGTAAGSWSVSGDAEGERTPTGEAIGEHAWDALAHGASGGDGSAEGQHSWTGSASGIGGTAGSADGEHEWVGSAVGLRGYSGDADGEHLWQGTAEGKRSRAGEASGEHAWSGTAHGRGTPIIVPRLPRATIRGNRSRASIKP